MINEKIQTFTDLRVWDKGHQLVLMIYQGTKNFPKEETYALIDQMRSSAASITANIAEGFGRQTYKEKLQFYYMAQGSPSELKNFIIIAKDVGYISQDYFKELIEQADITHQILQGFIQKTKSFLNR